MVLQALALFQETLVLSLGCATADLPMRIRFYLVWKPKELTCYFKALAREWHSY